MAQLAKKVDSITKRIGDPFDERSMMGPIISARQLGIVEELVGDARERGLEIVAGGKRMDGISQLDGVDLGKGSVHELSLRFNQTLMDHAV